MCGLDPREGAVQITTGSIWAFYDLMSLAAQMTIEWFSRPLILAANSETAYNVVNRMDKAPATKRICKSLMSYGMVNQDAGYNGLRS